MPSQVRKTTQVEPGASVGVFGLGAVGLAVVQAAAMAGASRIFAVDTNPAKFEAAKALGATDFVDPSAHDKPIQQVLAGRSNAPTPRPALAPTRPPQPWRQPR